MSVPQDHPLFKYRVEVYPLSSTDGVSHFDYDELPAAISSALKLAETKPCIFVRVVDCRMVRYIEINGLYDLRTGTPRYT